MKTIPAILPFAFALLAACSAETDTAGTPTAEVPAATMAEVDILPVEPPAADPFGNFDTQTSIRTLMNAMVQTNADVLWKAVRYVVNEDGVQEDVRPETDADWARLEASAVALIEAGNALLVPGRAVDHEIPGADYPDYTRLPVEIEELMAADAEGWRFYVEQMQFATRETLEAIENRDLLGLMGRGAAINNACNGCHGAFWYRPN